MNRHQKSPLAWVVLAVVMLVASCDLFGPGDDVVRVTDDITYPTTWLSGTVYVIEDPDLWIEATLTIQPGTIVKLRPSEGAIEGRRMTLGSGGKIIADGTPASPIVFTSYYDDEHGGDTNGDGNATSPASRDWDQIETNSEGGSRFDCCQFFYGGGGAYRTTLSITAGSMNVTVTDCLFAHNDGGMVGSFYYGALDATGGAAGVLIQNNLFYDNNLPLSVSDFFSLDDSNVFENPDPPNEDNTLNGVYTYTGTIDGAISWAETDVAFVINDADWWIDTGGSLTLADGVVLKFTEGGTLVLQSGAVLGNSDGPGVVFTSFYDDDYLGDTNGDGYSEGLDGDWNGILVAGTGYVSWPNIWFDSH